MHSKQKHAMRYPTLFFSSMLDPEECYPTAKALGDVGIFEDRPYRGAGIKIGIIDEGIPKSLASYGAGAEA